MKQSLQLRLGQQLTMTPQLQQSIRLLQLSSLNLQQEIQEALDSNVMLEVDESNSNTNDSGTDDSPSLQNNTLEKNSSELNNTDTSGDDFMSEANSEQVDFENTHNNIPDELSTDFNWDDVYDTGHQYTAGQSNTSSWNGDDTSLFENNGKTEDSLREHLLWQMEMTPFSDTDREIANAIIDTIDAVSYTHLTLPTI